jgi:hypothetical protein
MGLPKKHKPRKPPQTTKNHRKPHRNFLKSSKSQYATSYSGHKPDANRSVTKSSKTNSDAKSGKFERHRLSWFALVCDGLRWFAVVCGGLCDLDNMTGFEQNYPWFKLPI